MKINRAIEYVFFFGLLAVTGYLVWLIAMPFISALALSAIIVTICYPLYERILKRVPKQNKTTASLLTTIVVLLLIILPLVLIFSLVAKEMLTFYQHLNSDNGAGLQNAFNLLETKVKTYVPGFHLDAKQQIQSAGIWLLGNIGTIFASTVSTLFLLTLSILGSFYFFRDGKELMQLLIRVSPLPDHEDEIVFDRMARAVRAVATGTLLLALVQGTIASIGFLIFGLPQPLMWGLLAAMGALMPGIGTAIATVPATIYLFATGQTSMAIGMVLYALFVIGIIDNFVGPYLMGRRNNMHPFIILIAVLGGINLFGPVGFIVGPVIVTLFFVLLEIYNKYIIQDKPVPEISESEEII
jgi:predicted PurR-regulated permease PerM